MIRQRAGPASRGVALGQLDRAVQHEVEASAPRGDEANLRALLLEPPAGEDEPALEVVAEGGQPQRRVEAQLAVREGGAAFAHALPEQLPQDAELPELQLLGPVLGVRFRRERRSTGQR
jgi:hypothetical protein